MEIIKIGNQEWSVLNLNVDHFNNGDIIPEIKDVEEWEMAAKQKQPACCFYNNDSENGVQYGRLYNWYAATDFRGIIPEGYRLPSKEDIETLIVNLAGGTRGSIEMISEKRCVGKDLKKNISDWEAPGMSKASIKEALKFQKIEIDSLQINNLNIGQGFNAMPGGVRIARGSRDFSQINSLAAFWTSTPDDYKYTADQIAFGISIEAYYFFTDYFSTLDIPKSNVKEGKSIRFMRNI